MGFSVFALIWAGCIWSFFKNHSNAHLAFKILFIVGTSGFFGAFALPTMGNSIAWLEFPAVFGTKTILANDGRRYAAINHLQRIQRYSPTGAFERGWFVDSAGGIFLIGLTADGNIAAASARKDHLEVFNHDGAQIGESIIFDDRRVSYFSSTIDPSEFQNINLGLVKAKVVDNPVGSPLIILLLPLWHPFLSMLIAAFGGVGAHFQKST